MSNFFHAHNLVDPSSAERELRFGIRASLPSTDPFTRLVGTDWTRELWYADETERDTALAGMQQRHGYYRQGDDVSVVYQAIER